ncbi:bifunctional phosphopantothenoylcysteine decarboxylase/phosphopantothenate--cysteine ligase CoaBC [Candidatus Gottesmanbacteria bacterium CG_4_10_14_0_8_um_filter_37_24]|uniref:Coenzyme A biosynthesis bifunctional protein CoaBC n=1 Tax=Candidatus Gottesmanbacteria bacterium CG_4_10_14_0_8_um_filter_37_24 TaxID=1974574 RepID=A0A2M7RRF0_9BACT|nr:MAG: bifunctional phosphopantothenoylcysteine decarboxylase/phosphopantothenate--cysteine ligase CoaBC [Candidatus Gottesmanbacteria bacterium CG23_combo_of_CG06-09_8_20_14_all_37_19]PIZ02891.1 MAG: bifunctional phosphopantothenoylcysteine decarboxylase/phosphopantothenate--cysteine ligase CoaBC [Candidatus Gottesmanbacteria bacterium CG_4_10_14_0_8_um_filter_37_24]
MNIKSPVVLIGITGGVAGYKSIELIRLLRKNKAKVYVIMTKNAAKMYPIFDYEKASGNKVHTEIVEEGLDYRKIISTKKIDHIMLADLADIYVIVPATANIIGKLAHGLADDFVTTVAVATKAPIFVCPSMNVHMWENRIVSENIGLLVKRGFYILPPVEGELACGYRGVGRLPDVKIIYTEIMKILKEKCKLKGKKIIVTAGATLEQIDDVRLITNKGSGKMGLSIADECVRMGAEVLFLRSESSVKSLSILKEKIFSSYKDLERLIKSNVRDYDVIFHTASVSDFVPEYKLSGKIESDKSFELKLKSTPKILHMIKVWNSKIRLIGFKAIYKIKEEDIANIARNKILVSNSDYLVVNDVGRKDIGFGSDENEVYLFSRLGMISKIPRSSKREVARQILEKTVDEAA